MTRYARTAIALFTFLASPTLAQSSKDFENLYARWLNEQASAPSFEDNVRRVAASGRRFLYFSRAETGSFWFVEAPGLLKAWDTLGDYKSVWVRVDYSADKTVKARSAMQKLSFNCRYQTYQEEAYAEYDAQGTNIKNRSGGWAYAPVVPETMTEMVMRMVCDRKY